MIPEEFKDMRPFEPEELPAAYDSLLADPMFRAVVGMVMPQIPAEALGPMMHGCKTCLEFQYTFIRPLLDEVIKKCTTGLTSNLDNLALSKERENYTYISNHRDIVLDSGLLDMVLFTQMGFNTVEIAIGDNLLIYPWIKTLVKLNKAFTVKRGLSPRELMESSQRMSRYMHYAIQGKRENIWIAQREGRAKDSSDHTQESLLKMFAMAGEGSVIDRLKELCLVPLSISYEYDPCDYLKAQEFQQKRDDPSWKKSKQDDLDNMKIGIFGFKGHVHYRTGTPVNQWIDELKDMPKTEIFKEIALRLDKAIHSGYMLYPGNFIAYDELHGTDCFKNRYSQHDKKVFEEYINGQIAKIKLPNPDVPFLREKLLAMYANPVINKEKAVG